jgi:hypothetical protein
MGPAHTVRLIGAMKSIDGDQRNARNVALMCIERGAVRTEARRNFRIETPSTAATRRPR